MYAVLINGEQFSVLKSSMDKNSLKNIHMFHFFGYQLVVYLACESVAPVGGVQAGHILVFQNIKPQSLETLFKIRRCSAQRRLSDACENRPNEPRMQECCVVYECYFYLFCSSTFALESRLSIRCFVHSNSLFSLLSVRVLTAFTALLFSSSRLRPHACGGCL